MRTPVGVDALEQGFNAKLEKAPEFAGRLRKPA
jgi:hypothetical protein